MDHTVWCIFIMRPSHFEESYLKYKKVVLLKWPAAYRHNLDRYVPYFTDFFVYSLPIKIKIFPIVSRFFKSPVKNTK